MDQQHFGRKDGQQPAGSLAEIFVEGTSRIIELQSAAARTLWTQGRTAAMLGAPDWLRAVAGWDDAKTLFDIGARHMIDTLRETNRMMADLQEQFSQLLQLQSRQLTDQMRQAIEDMGRRSREGVEEWRRSASQGAERAQRFAHEVTQHGQNSQEAGKDVPALVIPGANLNASETRAGEERARSRRSG